MKGKKRKRKRKVKFSTSSTIEPTAYIACNRHTRIPTLLVKNKLQDFSETSKHFSRAFQEPGNV